jgi:hypothetical protein
MTAMAERAPPSAAQSLYPNLPSATPDVVEKRQQGTVAAAMYPSLVPKPKSPNPYLGNVTESQWRDYLWSLAGLRRKR